MTRFIKEDKYIVLKRRDVESALDKEMQQILQYLCQKVEEIKLDFNKRKTTNYEFAYRRIQMIIGCHKVMWSAVRSKPIFDYNCV